MDDIVHNETDFVGLAADIVGAYVSKNNVPAVDLPALIAATHAALTKLGAPLAPVAEKPVPLMPIKKTVTPDYLISLEDGRQYKSLKRHLSTRGLTPDQYREKWGLPYDYPMVAASYAAQRSELAKSLGLGQIRRQRAAEKRAAVDAKVSIEPKKGRGRPKKTASK